DDEVAARKQDCSPDVAKQLIERAGFVFVIDARGPRWLSAKDVLAAAGRIDTPAKALLAAWVKGHSLDWYDGHHGYGGAENGLVRPVDGGYEVVAGDSKTDGDCGGKRPRETVTNYRLTLFVDATGAIQERDRVISNSYDVADPCHPLGRRPEGFADVSSG